jgi:hypothetical protein
MLKKFVERKKKKEKKNMGSARGKAEPVGSCRAHRPN